MIRISLCLICLLPMLTAQLAGPVRTGQIFGKVMGEDGSAIAGSRVSLELLPPYPKKLPQTEWGTVTDSGGVFCSTC